MLVLSRKISETIHIGPDIAITVVRIGPNSVRIGVTAPKNVHVVRGELVEIDANQVGSTLADKSSAS